MASIRVQNLPGVKTNRLPAGVSSRENRINSLHMGKQMVAGYACWCAHKQKCLVAAGRYREVSAGMRWRGFPSRSAFEMLERYAMKVARTVLRGGSGSNATPLPDPPTLGSLARFQAFFYASAFSQSDGVPPPAPARVTQTVRQTKSKTKCVFESSSRFADCIWD